MTDIIIFFLVTLGSILSLLFFFLPIYLLIKVSSLSRRIRELENRSQAESIGAPVATRHAPDSYEAFRAARQDSQQPSQTTAEEKHARVTESAEPGQFETSRRWPESSHTAASVTRHQSTHKESSGEVARANTGTDQAKVKEPTAARKMDSGSVSHSIPESVAPSVAQQGWQKLEKALAENWTGILGTIILVVGVGFLGIYAALKMGPFLRFLMVLGIGAGLFGLSLYLARQKHWRPLAYWLRSGSGAVLLLACLGSALFPAMRWIQDENLALAVILIGVAANLALAWWSSIQTVASIHTAISILALLILPKSPLLFSIIGGISGFSTYLSYRAKWEFHLLQAVSVFLLASMVYGYHYGAPATDINPTIRYLGLGFTAAVTALGLLLHYRSRYRNQVFEHWPFISHIVTWATAALGFALYSTGSKYNSFLLFAIGLAVYVLARSRKSGPSWLYHTDSIMALFISILGALTLNRWQWDSLAIALVISALSLAFSVASSLDRAKILKIIGLILLHFVWLSIAAISLAEMSSDEAFHTSGILLASMVLTLAYLWFDWTRTRANYRKAVHSSHSSGELAAAEFPAQSPLEGEGESSGSNSGPGFTQIDPEDTRLDAGLWIRAESHFSLAGIFAGIFFALVCVSLRNQPSAEFYLSALALLILLGRHGLSVSKLASSAIPVTLGLHFLVIYRAWDHTPGIQFFTDAPLLALHLGAIMLAPMNSRGSQPMIQSRIYSGLLVLHLATLVYLLTNGYSSLLPGVLWLLFSVLFLELDRIRSFANSTWLAGLELARPVWFLGGLLSVALFLISHLVVDLQSEALLGPFRARLLIQLFAIGVFFYWARFSPLKQKYDKGLGRITTLFWELALIFLTIAISLELEPMWLPVVWVFMALLLFFSRNIRWIPARFKVYSTFYFWTSVLHTGFLSGTQNTPSVFWLDQAWLGGLVAIAGQLGYLIYRYTRTEEIASHPGMPVSKKSGASSQISQASPDSPLSHQRIEAVRQEAEGADWLSAKFAGIQSRERKELTLFYPLFLSVALFLFWSFDSALLTLFWMVEVFVVFFVGLRLNQDHFRYVAQSAMVLCLIRLLLFDLSQSSIVMRAFVFLGVGGIMILMNVIYRKYRSAQDAEAKTAESNSASAGSRSTEVDP